MLYRREPAKFIQHEELKSSNNNKQQYKMNLLKFHKEKRKMFDENINA